MNLRSLLVTLALFLAACFPARAQLTWQSYNTSGVRQSASAATYNSATNTYTFTIPASTTYTFVTTGFVPVGLSANQTKTVAFTMNASGGFGAAGSPVQNQRFIAYGLFNYGATAPGASGSFTDDVGLWTDSYQQSSGIAAEVFGGTSTTANLLGYAGATLLGAGTGPSSGAAGQFVNNVATNVTFRAVMNSAGTSSSIGTGTATDAAGAWYQDAATSGTTFNRTIYSAGTSTVSGSVTFNEFGFLFYNSTASPVTLTLANFSGLTPVITTQPTNVLAAPGSTATFAVTTPGGVTFQWQSSSDGGTTFTNIDTAANPSAATASLSLTNVQTTTASFYRVVVTPTGGAATASNSARLVVPSTSNTTVTPQVNVAIRSTVRGGITVTGAAAIGSASSVWNNLTGAAPSGTLMSQDYLSNAALVSDTGAATSVALTLNATSPDHTQSAVMHAFNDGTTYPTITPIMNYYTYYWWTSKLTLTMTGLRPGTSYDLYGYGTGNANTQGSLWTLDNANGGTSATCLADFTSGYTRDVTNTNNLGHSYVKLAGTADNSGTLKVVVDHSATSGDPYFNGFQVTETPQTTITSQPSNTNTTVGASASLAIAAATGQAFLWQKSTDGGSTWTTISPSSNATSATTTLAVSNCQTSDAGLYRALVLTSAGGLVVSSSATLSVVPNSGSTVDTAVNVAFRPSSQSGAPAVTGAAAAGSAGSVWNNLVGASPSSSLLTQALVSNAALVDDSGAATSKTATITVTAGSNSVAASQHTFNDGTTLSPSSIMNYYSYWWWTAYLTVNVTGLKPNGLYYVYGYGTGNAAGQGSKWLVDSTNGGATGEAPADFGSGYTRDVTNVANLNHSYVKLSATATSSGTLTFVINHATGQNDPYVNGFQVVPQALPTITAQPPANATATLAGSFSVGVTATGPGTLSYQWQKSTDGGSTFANISGASNASAVTSTLSLSNVQTSDAGTYRVLVMNGAGTVVSSNCVVTTDMGQVAPTIQSQPSSTTVLAGASASFTVGASGTSPLSYQWQKSTDGGSTYSNVGTNSATLSFASATLADAGTYRVTITNSIGSTTSNAVTLTVNQAPVINTQPVAATIASGASYTLSVAVTAYPAPTFQWKLNGANISGATSSSYTITNATGANAGSYSCVVTNSIGSVTSNSVYVGVLSSAMTVTSVGPTNGATSLNRDALLKITFNQPVSVGSSGRIRVYDASAPGTPVDTIDMSTAHVVNTTNGATVLASGSYMQKTISGLIFDYQPVTVSGNTATIALHSSTALSYGKTYYVNIEPGVLLDATGATFTGISDNATWTFSTKASGLAASAASITVAADGSGDFDTVQGAIDFVPYSPANTIARTITVKNGTYTEYVHFRSGQNLVTLKGESQSGVVIQYLVNNFVLGDLPNQNTLDPRGVFSCSTNDVTLQNLTIKNLTPNGGSQAEALVHGGQRFIANHISLFSYQDTLLAGGGTAFYTDSYIEGAVDYIWGGAQAFFQRCELKANTNNTYYTQARNSSSQKGYAFVNCTLDAYPFVSASTTSLSRTFFDYSQTIYIHCKMGPHVRPAGWSLVSGNTDTLQLWEFENTDLNGAPLDVSQRPTYNHSFSVSGTSIVYTSGASSSPDVFDHQQVSAAMAALFSTPSAFFGTWTPAVAPTFDTQPAAAQTIVVGQPATFTAAATGFPDPTYQWQKNGAPINGATSASYTIPSAAVAHAGTYTVVATNSAGSTTSSAALLAVNDVVPPTIAAPNGGYTPLTIATGAGGTAAVPNYLGQATITDDTGVVASSQSPAAGTNVSVGTTHVTLTASDAAGNTASTSFDVSIADGTPPTITGTFAPLTLVVGAGGTVALPNYAPQAVTTDNVSVAGVVQLPAAGTAHSVGTTHVTLTVSDTAGNTASTGFDVAVLSIAQNWRLAHFGTAENSGDAADDADPDHDGIPNLLEFAFGTDPLDSNSGPSVLQYGGTFAGGGAIQGLGQPAARFESITNGIDFRALFVRRADFAAVGLTYTVEFSATLGTWQASTAAPTVLADDGTLQIVSVPYPVAVGGKKARFFRVHVTSAP